MVNNIFYDCVCGMKHKSYKTCYTHKKELEFLNISIQKEVEEDYTNNKPEILRKKITLDHDELEEGKIAEIDIDEEPEHIENNKIDDVRPEKPEEFESKKEVKTITLFPKTITLEPKKEYNYQEKSDNFDSFLLVGAVIVGAVMIKKYSSGRNSKWENFATPPKKSQFLMHQGKKW